MSETWFSDNNSDPSNLNVDARFYAFEHLKSLSLSKQDNDSEYNGFVNKMQARLKDYLSSSTI